MVKLTREQVLKINRETGNGFMLDLYYWGIWGEKRLVRATEEVDGISYVVKVHFAEGFTGKYPEIVVDKQTAIMHGKEDSGLATITEMVREKAGEPAKRKNFKLLQKIAHDLDFDAWVEKAKAAKEASSLIG